MYIYRANPRSSLFKGALPVKQSTGHTHTGHTDRENTPDTSTHTRTTRPPNEHLPQALNNEQVHNPVQPIFTRGVYAHLLFTGTSSCRVLCGVVLVVCVSGSSP